MRARRRSLLALGATWLASAPVRGQVATNETAYPNALRGYPLVFPRDYGAHPDFRTEWWYVTGWLDVAGQPMGFQITFFRVRLKQGEGIDSRFAPKQLIFAHAAIADPKRRALVHAQDALRVGFGDAVALADDTNVRLRRWQLSRDATTDRYTTRIATRDFAFDFALSPTQPLLLQGDAGWSSKGPQNSAASYYYSLPHLKADGTLRYEGATRKVTGRAWFDHEWSSTYLDRNASGWDWIGINLDDGSALMAFRIRLRNADAPLPQLWAGATLRGADGRTRTYAPDEIEFVARRTWTSPRTQARYPVESEVRIGNRVFTVVPLFDDQELDSRASTGVIYWEGAVECREGGVAIGRGYLELTGYANVLRL